MNPIKIKIHSTGKYVPKKKVSNYDLSKWMETSHEWIYKRTGIETRYLSEGEDTSDLCIKASMKTLEGKSVNPDEIGLIIVATMTPDGQSPSVASKVQAALKATNAMAFDLNAACSGFVYALATAEKMLRHIDFPYALVLGGEVMSKTIDWSDRKTAVLFGDGAGGVLLKKNEDDDHFITEDLHANGDKGEALVSGKKNVSNPLVNAEESAGFLSMDGREIFNFVTKSIPKSIHKVLDSNDTSLEEVDYILLHQANARIIEIVAKKLGCPIEKFPMNIQKYGNTSAASLPILIDELAKDKKLFIDKKQKIILSAFGGGLTWGTLLLEIN
ncbi:beta-ketoacyl-ACP synthase III [Alkalibacterium olivapovliticus]|uniref:Beta-ketoacyl-[acyl-carrier-protein] synthase III n=1 Tax=Alkalibacterium olivapovliticus TaxID=99907 RepID=A0A2T0VSZ7_9LACT|nr:beta-ketoacyl-ACP synthase III [Alkalibacterium olivapovliticus]PRY73926.1 3-oxoacyl-[acyl-carrier-protein] synthase-3 [Alkalibacterium olivapovliticus]